MATPLDVRALTMAGMLLWGLSCDSQDSRVQVGKKTVAQASRPLSGRELAELDFELQQKLQEQITTKVLPLFQECGVGWGQRSEHGTAHYGSITLQVRSDGETTNVRDASKPTPRVDVSEEQEALDNTTAQCVERAFETLSFSSNTSPSDLAVTYPFCLKKPLPCPAKVSLPHENAEAFFTGLPDWHEDIHPVLKTLLGQVSTGSILFKHCRCGVCRVVSEQPNIESINTWMSEFTTAMNEHRNRLGALKTPTFAFTTERPMEVAKGMFIHTYVDFSSIKN